MEGNGTKKAFLSRAMSLSTFQKITIFVTLNPTTTPYKILKWQLGLGKLFGGDYEYALWVLQQDGLIGVSKAIKVNEKVKIVDGPFENYVASIESINAEKSQLKVMVSAFGRETPLELSFEQIEIIKNT